jgi:hypothetical protein
MLFLLEDKGLRGQRPSKSKTIEKQSRFFHGHFGEFECHRLRSFPKSI